MDLYIKKLDDKWNESILMFTKDLVVKNLHIYYNSESDLFINKLINDLDVNGKLTIDLTNDKKYNICCISNLSETLNEWINNNEIVSDFWFDYYKKN